MDTFFESPLTSLVGSLTIWSFPANVGLLWINALFPPLACRPLRKWMWLRSNWPNLKRLKCTVVNVHSKCRLNVCFLMEITEHCPKCLNRWPIHCLQYCKLLDRINAMVPRASYTGTSTWTKEFSETSLLLSVCHSYLEVRRIDNPGQALLLNVAEKSFHSSCTLERKIIPHFFCTPMQICFPQRGAV